MSLIKIRKALCLFSISILILLTGAYSIAEEVASKIRKPAVAGMFYPSNKNSLDKTIDNYFKEIETKHDKIHQHIFGIISPHAGYDFSGKVAAYGFSQIKGKSYKTVIIIGSSHHVPFRGVSIYPSGQWETPLGRVPVDSEFAQRLMNEYKGIKSFPLPFEYEHSLEVQLPFLQKTLKNFKIVPIVTGGMEQSEYRSFSDVILKLLKQNPKDILIVASSDMSHYHNYKTAQSMDALALKDIEEMNVERLIDDLDKGRCELCGTPGVVMLLMIAKSLNAQVKALSYMNSGDVIRDRNRVVGYSSVAFSYRDADGALNKKEQKTLLSIARKTLEEYVTNNTIPKFDIKEKRLMEKRGVFVTLTKKGDLRGCIGYIQPVSPLYRAVIDMTVAASSRDMRFLPVHKGELKDIHIEISVMTPLRLINNVEEIEVGKHGLYIKRGDNAGLLLPQVATTYNWNREEFLRETCAKAGLYKNAWKDKKTDIYTFTAQVFSE